MEYSTAERLSKLWRRLELGTKLLFALKEIGLTAEQHLREQGITVIKRLIKDGADVNFRDKYFDGKISLHLPHNSEITALLIEKGANVNAIDYEGNTPLHIAVHENMYSIAAVLLYYGADPSIVDQKGYTPLMYSLRSSKMTRLLINYHDYDFRALTCYCSSLLTEALINHSPFINDLIQHGATFNNLFYDSRLLLWCIDHQDSEQFNWLWDNFKYKEAWFYDTSILNYLLYKRKYDMFHHVIQSSQIGEVVEMMYDDMRNKIQLIPSLIYSKRLNVNKLLTAINQGYHQKRAEQAIFVLLSYGYVPYEHDAYLIFACIENSAPLIPIILLHPHKSVGWLIKTFLKARNLQKESLMSAASYIYDPRLIKRLEGMCYTNKDMLKTLRETTMPSLLELGRNATRSAIWKSCETKTARQFYTIIKNMAIPPVIKEIILFKLPLYHY